MVGRARRRAAPARTTDRDAAARTADTGRDGPPTSGPSSQSSPSQRRSSRIDGFRSRVDRSASVSSIRRMNVPPRAARQQPVEQRRAGVADVQLAGRARRESHAHASRQLSTAFTTSRASTQSDRVGGDRFAAAERADPFVGLALDAHAASRRSRAPPATLARIASMYGASFGRSAMTTTSTLTIAKPRSRDERRGARQQIDARGVLPTADRCRESAGRCRPRRRRRASRRSPRGTPRRRRSGRAARARTERDAAENQRPALDQPMQIVAGADANGASRRAPVGLVSAPPEIAPSGDRFRDRQIVAAS